MESCCLHEVFPIFVKSSDLEDVQDVVDVEFCAAVWEDGADEVGVALIVEIIAAEEFVYCFHC